MSSPSLSFAVDGIDHYYNLCQQLHFSERELEVLECLSYGKNAAEIAQELRLAPSTINKYLSLIRAKLNAKDTTHLVCIAFRSGLIS